MASSTRTTLLCGGFAAAMGGFYVLQGLGALPLANPAPGVGRGMAAVVGTTFMAGGVAAMLTTVQTQRARAAIALLALVIVACFASIGGWIALGPGDRDFASPFAIFGPRANELSGRIAFGVGALISLATAMAMARNAGRAVRTLVSPSSGASQPEPH